MPRVFVNSVGAILSEIRRVLNEVDSRAVEKLIQELMSAEEIFVYGQGRTGHISRTFAVRLMHLGMKVHFVGETTTPAIGRNDLCLVNSGTGTTRFVYHVAAAAKKAGARLATITAHPEARIGQMADITVLIPAPTKGERGGPKGSIQPAGSLYEQTLLVVMDAMVMVLMKRKRITAKGLARRHANIE